MGEKLGLTLKEEHRLMGTGKIFVPKREELTRDWKKWHNEKLHDFLLVNEHDYCDQITDDEVGYDQYTHISTYTLTPIHVSATVRFHLPMFV